MADSATPERNEAYWYGPEGWPQLSSLLLRECMHHAEDLLDALHQVKPLTQHRVEECFLTPVAQRIEQKIQKSRQAGGSTRRLELALGLLAYATDRVELRDDDSGPHHRLTRHLEQDRQGLQEYGAAALYKNLQTLFNQARRGHRSTPHREANWQRIEAHISTLAVDFDPWHPQHQQLLLKTLRERFPHDHNLPRTVEGLLGYINEFYGHEVNHDTVDVNDLDELDTLLADTIALPIDKLSECLNRLRSAWADAYEVISTTFKLGDVLHLNRTALEQARGWSRRQADRLKAKGMQALGDCLRERLTIFYPEQD